MRWRHVDRSNNVWHKPVVKSTRGKARSQDLPLSAGATSILRMLPGGTILESHMREAISIAAGEFDHEMIQPTTDVVSGAGALSVIGLVTFV